MPRPLADVASLCYRCRHYDWAVLVGGDEAVWSDECNAPGEHKAGDSVQNCPGYEEEKCRYS